MFPKDIQLIISTYQFFGFIPLDKTLHVIVGAIITVVLRWNKVSMRNTFIILAAIELSNEVIDSQTLQSTLLEESMDFIATFIYPILLCCIIKIKKNLQVKILKQEREEREENQLSTIQK